MTRRLTPVVLFGLLGLLPLLVVACGKKGPPLAPLRPVPAAPSKLTARLAADQMTLRLELPATGADPTLPLSLARVEIYARSLSAGSPVPVVDQLLQPEYLVGSIDVQPTPDPDLDEPAAQTEASVDPGVSSALAALTALPAPGDMVTWTETVVDTPPVPLKLTRAQQARVAAQLPLWVPIAPSGLRVAVTPVRAPTRYYLAVGVSDRERFGPTSGILVMPFGRPPEPPAMPTIAYTETSVTVTWTGTGPARVIEATPAGEEQLEPVQEALITTGSWSTPVEFGRERCFVVRRVVMRGVVSAESASTAPVCVTPEDTYPPAAPAGLEGVETLDNVTLIWNPVSAPDLAGYLVLRGEGTGETLQPLIAEPIESLQFADTTTQAGIRYRYRVIAVDTAGNRSELSNRVIIQR